MYPPLSTIKASNLSHIPSSYVPVAVFVGGTSGIGQGMAEALAAMTKGKASIVLGSSYDSISCDVTLMRNVVSASEEILQKHAKISYLILTPGFFSTKGYEPTEEGIERKMAPMYYARWKFIYELLPALRSAKEAGQDAKMFSVLAAGRGGEIDVNDLGLQKSYSLMKAASSAATYNDLMIESYAELAPGLTFIHAFPGTVITNFAAKGENPLVRALAPVLNFALRPFARTRAEAAEYLWHGISSLGEGAFRTGPDGGDLGEKNRHGTEEQRKALWDHTHSLTNVSSRSGG